MSVIWGVWRRDGKPCAAENLARMGERLGRFGRDGKSVWTTECLGLGRALTMTLPEDSFDQQPVWFGRGSVLVADVRLDNRADLAEQLGIDSVEERRKADSQILAAAWERWQQDCLSRLVGVFAFAVWDEAAHRLFCARDHMGRRPLYYFAQGPLFAFSSLPSGLRGIPEVPWAVDEKMIAIRIAYLPDTGERTFFESIRKLPPAHCVHVTECGETLRSYWKPDLERRVTFSRDEDYCEALRDVFDESVRCRLRARAPVGSMLSGGFDSGSVTASAARLLAQQGQSLTAFTAVPAPEFGRAVPADRFGNESEHAASVAALYPNIRHVLVPPAPVCPLDLMARPRYWSDSPGSHFSMLPHAYAMSEAHTKAGVAVVLSGLMGNMTISYRGWSLMAQLIQRGRWRKWYQEAQGLRRSAHYGWPGVLAVSFGAWCPPGLWRALHADHSAPLARVTKYLLLNPRYLESGEISKLAAELGWDLSYRPRLDASQSRMEGLMRFDCGAGAVGGLAASGVDHRDPTIDRRLVEFCLAVPEDQYLRQGCTRYLLRRAMADRLSPLVLGEWRRGVCGVDWYLRVAPYQARFADAVERIAGSPTAQRCLDLERMRRLVLEWPADWSTEATRLVHGVGLCRAVHIGSFIRWVEEGGS